MTKWGIREEASYAEAVARLGVDVRRLDEALEGVTWAIARAGDDQDFCPDILGNGVRLARAQAPEDPESVLRVWFVLDPRSGNACLIDIDLVTQIHEEDDDDVDW